MRRDKDTLTISPAGTAKMKFTPGFSCGKSYGYEIRIENWIVSHRFHGRDGYSGGGVIDFKDIEKLYLESKKYLKRKDRSAPYWERRGHDK